MLNDSKNKRWDFWIDRGGTFTDIVARDPDGNIFTDKMLSENAQLYADAGIEGIKRFLKVPHEVKIPADNIDFMQTREWKGSSVSLKYLMPQRYL